MARLLRQTGQERSRLELGLRQYWQPFMCIILSILLAEGKTDEFTCSPLNNLIEQTGQVLGWPALLSRAWSIIFLPERSKES